MANPPQPLPERDFYEAWLAILNDKLKRRLTSKEALAEHICLSVSSVRKRLSQDVAFSAREFISVSSWLDLPISQADLEGRLLALQTLRPPGSPFDAAHYIASLRQVVDFYAAPIRCAESRVQIASTDAPVFWFLADPVLAAFKLFTFQANNIDYIPDQFRLSDYLEGQSEWIASAKAIAEGYMSVASEEIWGEQPLRFTLSQLEHLAAVRAFEESTVDEIFAALRRLVDKVGAAAQSGNKGGFGDFLLWRNRFQSSSSIIMVSCPTRGEVFVTFDNPNFVWSEASRSFTYFKEYFRSAQESAQGINGRGMYTPRRFKNDLSAQVERSFTKVKTLLSIY